MENKKWFEAFSNGEVWELYKSGNYLFGRRTYDDPSYFDVDEVFDYGISDFEEKARVMHLEPKEVD
jgi:hypothetical protein